MSVKIPLCPENTLMGGMICLEQLINFFFPSPSDILTFTDWLLVIYVLPKPLISDLIHMQDLEARKKITDFEHPETVLSLCACLSIYIWCEWL